MVRVSREQHQQRRAEVGLERGWRGWEGESRGCVETCKQLDPAVLLGLNSSQHHRYEQARKQQGHHAQAVAPLTFNDTQPRQPLLVSTCACDQVTTSIAPTSSCVPAAAHMQQLSTHDASVMQAGTPNTSRLSPRSLSPFSAFAGSTNWEASGI